MIKSTNHRGFPVVGEDGKLAGMVTRKDINLALRNGKTEIEVEEVMTRDLILCYPDESLKTALHRLAERNIGRLPVVDKDNEEQIIGLITRKSLIATYNRELERKTGTHLGK
jgi:CIC family chloride channel protein